MSAKETAVIPIEELITNVCTWEQYAAEVIDYTSKCNITSITSYSPENIVGTYVLYPLYGDSPNTYTLVRILSRDLDFPLKICFFYTIENIFFLIGLNLWNFEFSSIEYHLDKHQHDAVTAW